jgi:hypothetical protein
VVILLICIGAISRKFTDEVGGVHENSIGYVRAKVTETPKCIREKYRNSASEVGGVHVKLVSIDRNILWLGHWLYR